MEGNSTVDQYVPKTTGIPRPLSRLPQPRSLSQPSGIPTVSTIPSPTKVNVEPLAVSRQPLGTAVPTQTKQVPANQYTSSTDVARIARAKAVRHPSQQENAVQLGDSSDGSESPTSTADHTSPYKTPKRSRPSLADRTLESLSQVPPSPASNRRNSSFFNPQSPMTPARPTSAAAQQTTLPRANYGAARSNTIPRPISPSKLPGSAAALRSNPSTAVAKSALPAPSNMKSSQKPYNPRHSTVIPRSSTPQSGIATSGHARSMSMLAKPTSTGQRSNTTMSKPAATSTRPQVNQGRSLQRPQSMMPAPKSVSTDAKKLNRLSVVQPAANVEPETEVDRTPQLSSSAALRAKIAQAREAYRKATEKANQRSSQGSDSTASYSFEECEDPFNQTPKVELDPLSKSIEQARKDGKLNISSLGLKTLPEQVLKMYDAESMEKSSLTWSETIDLTKLIAADNELEELSEEVFPDISKESIYQDSDAKGNQFGGLETLDLHGNVLKALPIGLRRLERLSTLNLARNKLDSSVFTTVTQIHTLRSLDLGSNELARDLPESISLLFSLETLSLQSNKLSILPSSLRELTSLRSLDISSNRLSSLPLDALASLPNLQELNASHNAMTGALFLGKMTGFTKLTHLDISDNALASITFSPEAPDLPQLKHLNVSRNRMAMIPNMAGWTSLTTLLASDNMLMALPEGFTSLTKELRRVDFAGNGIRTIEDGIAGMEKLEWLSLQGNPLIQKKYLTMTTEDVKKELAKKEELDAALA